MDAEAPDPATPADEAPRELPRLQHPVRGRRLAPRADFPASPLTPEQRLFALDAWRRSGLPAGDFAPLAGISKHTLYAWKRKFETDGPAGLLDAPRGAPGGSRLPEATRRAILMLKEDNPDGGTERIAAVLLRGPALAASPQAVARVLREAASSGLRVGVAVGVQGARGEQRAAKTAFTGFAGQVAACAHKGGGVSLAPGTHPHCGG
jgi:transposase